MKKKYEEFIETLPIETDPNLFVCVMVNYYTESCTEYLVGYVHEMPNALRELLSEDVDMTKNDIELLEELQKLDLINIEWIDLTH